MTTPDTATGTGRSDDVAEADVGREARWHRWGRAHGPVAGVLAALLLVHVVVQLMARPYPRWGDAILTFVYARDFPDIPADQHSLRLGVLLPTRLFIEVFGFGQVAYYAFAFLAGIVLVVATFFVALRLFGLPAAAVATFLVVFHPILVRTVGNTTSWHVLPDVPAAAFFTAGLALLLEAARRASAPRTGRWQPGTGWLVASGAAFGWAYLCREFAAFMYVVIPLVFLLWHIPWRRMVFVAAPMAMALLVELVTAWVVWGDPLMRLQISAEHGSETDAIPRSVTLTKFADALYGQPRGTVSVLLIVLTVAGAVLLWRRETTLPAVWLVSFWFPLTAMGGLLNPTEPSLRLQLTRYWVATVPAMAIGAVGVATVLGRSFTASLAAGGRRNAGLRLAAVAVLALTWYAKPMAEYARDNPNDESWNALRSYLSQHDDIERISTDYRSADQLYLYSYEALGGDRVWDGTIEIFERGRERPPTADELQGDALLVTRQTARNRPKKADGWVPVWHEGGLRLYVAEDHSLEQR